MPAKRQIPPRPASRSLLAIVGATGGKDRDDGIVIDGASLPDDEGGELDPKPSAAVLASAPALPPAVPHVAVTSAQAAAPSLAPRRARA